MNFTSTPGLQAPRGALHEPAPRADREAREQGRAGERVGLGSVLHP